MKTTYAIASFLAAGAGALSAGAALNLAQYAGSDTELTIIRNLITQASITGITYVGGGSGAGETAMYNQTQTTAPMSRFFKAGVSSTVNNVCGSGHATTAEGVVIALDGLSILGKDTSITQSGGAGCGDLNEDGSGVSPAFKEPHVGLRSDGNFTWTSFESNNPHGASDGCSYVTYNKNSVHVPGGSYNFLDWQDVLKVLLAGQTHTYTITEAAGAGSALCPTGGAGTCAAGQDAGLLPGSTLPVSPAVLTATSPVRWALLANWSSIWEDQTDATCATGHCKCIHHIVRRDDWSGTTDTIVSALGLSSIPGDHSTDPFANSLHVAMNLNYPTGLPALDPQYMQSFPPPTDQDFDPIRVTCAGDGTAAGDDVVCEGDGTLGVMLPVEPSSDLTQAQAFPNATAGIPLVVGFAAAQAGNVGALPYTCLNGDTPIGVNNCYVPIVKTLGANGFANLVESGTPPVTCLYPSGKPTGTTPGLCVTNEDARVFNKMVHTATGAYQFGSNGKPIQSAFYRNWGPRVDVSAAADARCALGDATQDIGCVLATVPTESCSLGYAGLLATLQVGAEALRIDGVLPSTANVQTFAYPASRKLYFNTMIGFQNVVSPELDLAKAAAGGGGFLSGIITAQGFVNLPATAPNGTSPYTEDWNEIANCALGGTNSDATSANPSGIPTIHTTCGLDSNGLFGVDAFERCDDGGANSTSTSNCTNSCICGKGGVGTTGLCCFRYDVSGHTGVLWGTGLNGCVGTAYPSP